MEQAKKKELLRTLKYVLIAASAGLIQIGSTTILSLIWPVEKFSNGPVLFYLIGLVLSVIWNLTINRKYTFKSANNMGIAVLWTIGFYVIFTPASLLLQGWLTNGVLIEDSTLVLKNYLGWHTLIGTAICMVLNLGLEYPFQRFVVFRNSIDQTVDKTKQEIKEEKKAPVNSKKRSDMEKTLIKNAKIDALASIDTSNPEKAKEQIEVVKELDKLD